MFSLQAKNYQADGFGTLSPPVNADIEIPGTGGYDVTGTNNARYVSYYDGIIGLSPNGAVINLDTGNLVDSNFVGPYHAIDLGDSAAWVLKWTSRSVVEVRMLTYATSTDALLATYSDGYTYGTLGATHKGQIYRDFGSTGKGVAAWENSSGRIGGFNDEVSAVHFIIFDLSTGIIDYTQSNKRNASDDYFYRLNGLTAPFNGTAGLSWGYYYGGIGTQTSYADTLNLAAGTKSNVGSTEYSSNPGLNTAGLHVGNTSFVSADYSKSWDFTAYADNYYDFTAVIPLSTDAYPLELLAIYEETGTFASVKRKLTLNADETITAGTRYVTDDSDGPFKTYRPIDDSEDHVKPVHERKNYTAVY